jgi:CubicO group peptidase (beta-lactamase class C family)
MAEPSLRRFADLTLATIVLAAAPTASAQAPAGAKPESLDALLEPIRARNGVPALAGALVRGADVAAIGAVGVRAHGSPEKVEVDDRWHLGSCTKAMTATLAARLVERGDLAWSTTIGEVFGDLGGALHPAWRDVPIEWLLQHRAGVPSTLASIEGLGPRVTRPGLALAESRRALVEGVLATAPVHEPGTKFLYSNESFVIAAAMLERLEKKPWEELIRAEAFEPLGIASAGFGPPGRAKKVDQPRGHAGVGVEIRALAPGPDADNPAAYGPAGTVHMTLRDWARFVSAHLRGENGVDSILKAETFRKLHECPEFQTYALGWMREPRPWAGGDALFHSGSNTLWYCVAWLAPAKDVAFLAATNIGGDSGAKACDEAVVAMLQRLGDF